MSKAGAEIVPLEMGVEVLDADGVDDLGAGGFQLPKRVFEDGRDLGIRVFRIDEGTEHADALAFQPFCVKEGRIVVFAPTATPFRKRVRGVVTGDHVEHLRAVLDGAHHGSGDVAIESQGYHPIPARQSDRRANAEEGEMR